MVTKKKENIKNNKNDKKKEMAKIIIPIIAVIVFAYILYKIIKLIIVPTDMVMLENGTIYSEETTIGYVIRDEKIAKGKNTENEMIQIKSEGEKVAKGSQIFRYSSKNEDEINSKISELNAKIQEALLGQNSPFPNDVKAIEKQIENKIDGLKSKNNIQEISEYKKDINTYITKKSKIAGSLSKAGSYINGLIKEREEYQKKLKDQSEYITAPMSGVVSYRVDDLEETLTPENFEKLNKEFLEELNLKTGQIVATSRHKGKIINNYECYIATVLDSEEAKQAEVGKTVKLRLSTQDEVKAIITHISKQENNSVLVVFRIGDCVEKLIDYRKITFDVIWWKSEGLKVPKSAIIYDNGLSYVVRNRGGYQDKILVKILRENNKYCIIGSYDNEDLKNLGFTTNEIINMKKISIYDEIIVNPET